MDFGGKLHLVSTQAGGAFNGYADETEAGEVVVDAAEFPFNGGILYWKGEVRC